METTEKLIRITPQKLQAVFHRLEAEHTTRLAIIGAQAALSADPRDWPESVQGQQVFQLSDPWPGLVDRVIGLWHLDRLVLVYLDLGDAGARAIAECLTQLQRFEGPRGETGAVPLRDVPPDDQRTKDVAQRGAVLTSPGLCYRSSVSYNAGLKRYLWVQTGLGEDTRFAGGLAI